jgi:serine/threonine protein kinase
MCFNLIQQLLIIDPNKRPTVGDALLHPYWSEEPKACEKHE